MSKNQIITHFNGFHPSPDTKNFIETILSDMQRELPRGSIVRGHFSRQKKIMKGILQVQSNQGPFFAVASSESLREVALELTVQMRKRMEKWKSKRHDKHGLKWELEQAHLERDLNQKDTSVRHAG